MLSLLRRGDETVYEYNIVKPAGGVAHIVISTAASLVAMEDCCVICAEPMQFTAYGPCGHKEACSKCVTRLRFVLKDKRCVICQQPHPTVYVTKYLGDYTLALPANAFEEFQVTSNKAEASSGSTIA